MERLSTGTEIRAQGRKLSGVIMRYGDTSPSHRERFEPGSLRMAEAVHLDLFHDVEKAIAWHPGGGLELTQDREALTLTATLPNIPAANRALNEIRTGRTTGLSVEFKAIKTRMENGIRVIEEAILSGIGLVKAPSYLQSQVEARKEARRRSGRTMTAKIPANKNLRCSCAGVSCRFARYTQELLDEAMKETFELFEREAVATFGSYAKPLASASKGTMRGKPIKGGAEIEIDIPDSAAGTEMLAAAEDAGVIARPFLDQDTVVGTAIPLEGANAGQAMSYTAGSLRAIIISSSDEREGWPTPIIKATDDELAQADAHRRRRRAWL